MIDEKEWFKSRTIWGSLVAVTASLTGLFGVSLDQTAQIEIADTLVQFSGVVGSVIAIYGRLGATEIIS